MSFSMLIKCRDTDLIGVTWIMHKMQKIIPHILAIPGADNYESQISCRMEHTKNYVLQRKVHEANVSLC